MARARQTALRTLQSANLPVRSARSNKSGSSVVIRSELKKPTAIDATLRHGMGGGTAAEPPAWMAAATRKWLENAGATAEGALDRAFNVLPLSGVHVLPCALLAPRVALPSSACLSLIPSCLVAQQLSERWSFMHCFLAITLKT